MNALPERLASLEYLVPCHQATACVPEATARRLNLVPMALLCCSESRQLVVAGDHQSASKQLARLSRQLPDGVDAVCIATDIAQLAAALDKVYKPIIGSSKLLEYCRTQSGIEKLEREQSDYLIQLLEYIVTEAIRLHASDIHLSPDRAGLLVRFRIDGLLSRHFVLHERVQAGLLARIKILAALDIAECRYPQDGQFTQLIDAHQVDFRVSTFPTMRGENTVLRVLDENETQKHLQQLKLPAVLNSALLQQVLRPDGLLLVCGPTGSGKSTTLYALLGERDSEQLNIMTLEDPVERSVAGLCQASIDASRSLDYSHGIRALLRQDPDVLMIGEIRDASSCAMALRAAMTGHQVLSTVHAKSAFAVIDRLRELGASNVLLATNLTAVACQRLVRKRCVACAGDAQNCTVCRNTGFLGRQVIMELLLITPEIAAQIAAGAEQTVLELTAAEQGFITLRARAGTLVDQGVTTCDEVDRVLGALDFDHQHNYSPESKAKNNRTAVSQSYG